MSITVLELKSPLSQVSTCQTSAFLELINHHMTEPLEEKTLNAYGQAEFALLFIASGGSEGIFCSVFERIRNKPFYLLSSPDSNSLAASMEILAYLRQQGCTGEILHGDPASIAARIELLRKAAYAKAKLSGMKIGVVGTPSDWLIASGYDTSAYAKKLSAEIVEIPMQELQDAYAQQPVPGGIWVERLRAIGYAPSEVEKALTVYAALRQLVNTAAWN
jgi:L-fucose isomerase-like protein